MIFLYYILWFIQFPRRSCNYHFLTVQSNSQAFFFCKIAQTELIDCANVVNLPNCHFAVRKATGEWCMDLLIEGLTFLPALSAVCYAADFCVLQSGDIDGVKTSLD